jgi:uncharacterized protein (DUF1501 family)
MSKHHHHLSRRGFIGQASCAAIGYTTLFNTLVNLKTMNAAALSNSLVANGGDYKAMVCLVFGGGCDSHNMLIPTETTAYNHYANTRTNLAIPFNDILGLNGTDHGVHPSMPNVQQLYNDNKLAFLANTGTLVEPTTKAQFYDGSVDIPLGLYSHVDQAQQWQTSIPHERTNIGWGGKVADLLSSMNTNSNISMNISLNGSNIFQRGNQTIEYTVHPYNGSVGIREYGGSNTLNQLRTAAIDNMVEASYQDIFKQSYVDVIRVSRDAHIEFSAAIDAVPEFSTVTFSDNDLSQSFKMVAKTIAARNTLNFTRQIFFIEYGGWDHHDEVLNAQVEMLGEVDDALHQFITALEEINASDCVTTFTMSEFGRTLTSNGNGTDHAWGGNVMMMGGAVNGGNIYGSYPSLELDNPDEVGGGVLIPGTSVDEYFAELALWFGVSASDLSTLFPNIGNFYSTGSGVMPLGFLNL